MRRNIFTLLLFTFISSSAQININYDNDGNVENISVKLLKPEVENFSSFEWENCIPQNCPFKQSTSFNAIKFLGVKSGFHYGDTFYPTWADNDILYSPYTDGGCWRLDGSWDYSLSTGDVATTGQAALVGDDPTKLIVYSLGTETDVAIPYQGRYPCASLHYNGIWYYGTYCLSPAAQAQYGSQIINWPWMGPFVGFRLSKDNGLNWINSPHTPSQPLFNENGMNGYPIKIGAPHFVDFGKNMQYSPDGKAYMIAHGADVSDSLPRFWNDSWITGDQVYLLRVIPSEENINNMQQWEFYAGKDTLGKDVWTHDFAKIKPLLEWNNNMGCVTVTYNNILKKYLMCVTDGGNTCAKMNTYVLESDSLTGEWKIISYMKNFGEQAYFVNILSKFIEQDCSTMWLRYSGNYALNWNGETIKQNPPGSHYGLVMQKIKFINKYIY